MHFSNCLTQFDSSWSPQLTDIIQDKHGCTSTSFADIELKVDVVVADSQSQHILQVLRDHAELLEIQQ